MFHVKRVAVAPGKQGCAKVTSTRWELNAASTWPLAIHAACLGIAVGASALTSYPPGVCAALMRSS